MSQLSFQDITISNQKQTKATFIATYNLIMTIKVSIYFQLDELV